jgi:hypothetical protein
MYYFAMSIDRDETRAQRSLKKIGCGLSPRALAALLAPATYRIECVGEEGGESRTSSHTQHRAEPRATLFLHVLSEFAQRAVGCGVGYRPTLPKLFTISSSGRGRPSGRVREVRDLSSTRTTSGRHPALRADLSQREKGKSCRLPPAYHVKRF